MRIGIPRGTRGEKGGATASSTEAIFRLAGARDGDPLSLMTSMHDIGESTVRELEDAAARA